VKEGLKAFLKEREGPSSGKVEAEQRASTGQKVRRVLGLVKWKESSKGSVGLATGGDPEGR